VDRLDVFHTPYHYGLPAISPCATVITLHDAIEQIFYRVKRPLREKLTRASLLTEAYERIARSRAIQVITVSEFSKNDLVRELEIEPSRITVTYEAAEPFFSVPTTPDERATVLEKLSLHAPFFFYVGGWEERKNLTFLLRAFAEAKLDGTELVLAGSGADRHPELEEYAISQGLAGAVRWVGWISDLDLKAIYSSALAFVFPSSYEGFGLPLCEAMACGAPVLAARSSCLPEILGNGGLSFDLGSTRDLVMLLQKLASDTQERERMAQRARARGGDFSWKRMAQETLAVYRKARRIQSGA
jgi:glycosyltransferase involved in cell wall biosynthesis